MAPTVSDIADQHTELVAESPAPQARPRRAGQTLAAFPGPAREGLVLTVVIAVGVAVVGFWFVNVPFSSLRSSAEALTAAGHVTGLVGTYLILVEVVLMARLPWLDRSIGPDRLAVWHRRNGGYAIGLLVAHAILTIAGYAISDGVSLTSETSTVVLSYPDMLAATVGLVLLIAVGVSSARIARRRMRYETWYFVHLYAYVALALSFAHQLATGGDFATHPLSRALWVLLYVAAAGAIVVWRVVLPLSAAVWHRLSVTHLVTEAPGVVSVYMTGRHLDDLAADAGQFFWWRFMTRSGWWQAHPYSLSAAPNGEFLRITAKAVGDHSAEISQLRKGTFVFAEGPHGAFTRLRRQKDKVLLIGGGVGITPLRALFEELAVEPGQMTLLYRAGRPEEVVFTEELNAIALHKGAQVRYLVGPRTMVPDPLSATSLAELVPGLLQHDVYICAPAGMSDATVRALRDAGVPRSQIHTERFAL